MSNRLKKLERRPYRFYYKSTEGNGEVWYTIIKCSAEVGAWIEMNPKNQWAKHGQHPYLGYDISEHLYSLLVLTWQ